MPELEDFERDALAKEVDSEEYEDDAEEDQSTELLGQCLTLLNYVSNPNLCKSITMRERKNMAHFAQLIADYLNGGEVDE